VRRNEVGLCDTWDPKAPQISSEVAPSKGASQGGKNDRPGLQPSQMPLSPETQADGLGWYGVAPSVLGARPPCGLAEHNGVRFLRQGDAFHNISDVESLAAEEPAGTSTTESGGPGTDVIEISDGVLFFCEEGAS
jgi:hypothetical protein